MKKEKKQTKLIQQNLDDFLLTSVINILLVMITVIMVLPMLYMFSVSLTPYTETLRRGGVIFYPTKLTLEYYQYIFRSRSPLLNAYIVTSLVTVLGTITSLFLTVTTAFPLSRSSLPGKKLIMSLFFFTMLFSGGMMPTYLVVKGLKLIDSLGALIFPAALSVYYMIIMISFFKTIPESLIESAKMDGANDIYVLFRIVVPLSKPAIASMALFYAVARWNSYFDAMIYINDSTKKTLQIVLRETLLLSQITEFTAAEDIANMPPLLPMQMSITAVAILPMMILYPILQKYFVKGIMIGAVKG